MAEYKVAEIFTSINGEGMYAGRLAVFVRFCGAISGAVTVIQCGLMKNVNTGS